MAFWGLLLFLLVVITVGVLVYRQDNSAFSKLTGYSLFDILFKRQAKHLHKMMTQLDQVQGEHKILLDVAVPNEQEQVYADSILVHESGIYVVTAVQKKGWITGDEAYPQWSETLHKGKNVFANPITVNEQVIEVLQQVLPEVNVDAFSSLIVFSDACSIQKIETTSQDVEVLKTSELKKWTKQIGGEVLSADEIAKIYKVLAPYMSFAAATK